MNGFWREQVCQRRNERTHPMDNCSLHICGLTYQQKRKYRFMVREGKVAMKNQDSWVFKNWLEQSRIMYKLHNELVEIVKNNV